MVLQVLPWRVGGPRGLPQEEALAVVLVKGLRCCWQQPREEEAAALLVCEACQFEAVKDGHSSVREPEIVAPETV